MVLHLHTGTSFLKFKQRPNMLSIGLNLLLRTNNNHSSIAIDEILILTLDNIPYSNVCCLCGYKVYPLRVFARLTPAIMSSSYQPPYPPNTQMRPPIATVHFERPKVPVVFVLGGPGSGREAHSDRLALEFRSSGLVHINMMNLLEQCAVGNGKRTCIDLIDHGNTAICIILAIFVHSY